MCYVTHSLRFTSGVTPADLLAASMAAEPSLPHTCKALVIIKTGSYHAATHSVRSGRPNALPTELTRLGYVLRPLSNKEKKLFKFESVFVILDSWCSTLFKHRGVVLAFWNLGFFRLYAMKPEMALADPSREARCQFCFNFMQNGHNNRLVRPLRWPLPLQSGKSCINYWKVCQTLKERSWLYSNFFCYYMSPDAV